MNKIICESSGEEIDLSTAEGRLENLLSDKYSEALLIYDCVPAFLDYLQMVRDNSYTIDRNSDYARMLGFILQELDLIEVSRTYLSDLDEITIKGLKILNG